MIFSVADAINWLNNMNKHIQKQKGYLTDLDRIIGDGDHGINMARGFQAIADQLNESEVESVADVVRLSAHTLMTTVGGAAGILYATAFLNMATVFQEEENINHTHFTTAFERAVNGIESRGNVKYGEKTLLDVWVEILHLFQKSDRFPKSHMIEGVAHQAMEDTKRSVARKGKAALYESNSVGHIDPGAASTYYLFVSLAETCKENEDG